MDYGPHQTRLGPLTPHEKALGDALERVLAAGTHDLADIVAALNAPETRDSFGADLAPPGGGPWTEDNFRAEMARLGR